MARATKEERFEKRRAAREERIQKSLERGNGNTGKIYKAQERDNMRKWNAEKRELNGWDKPGPKRHYTNEYGTTEDRRERDRAIKEEKRRDREALGILKGCSYDYSPFDDDDDDEDDDEDDYDELLTDEQLLQKYFGKEEEDYEEYEKLATDIFKGIGVDINKLKDSFKENNINKFTTAQDIIDSINEEEDEEW